MTADLNFTFMGQRDCSKGGIHGPYLGDDSIGRPVWARGYDPNFNVHRQRIAVRVGPIAPTLGMILLADLAWPVVAHGQ